MNRCLVRWASQGSESVKCCNSTKCREVEHAHHTEVIASCSELLSLHCPRHPLLLALLPACAGSQVIMRQDCSAYAAEPLHTAGLLEAAHQYSLQDMCRSARTPTPLHPVLRGNSLRTDSLLAQETTSSHAAVQLGMQTGGAIATARAARRIVSALRPHNFRIPFGDHPLKLERYRED